MVGPPPPPPTCAPPEPPMYRRAGYGTSLTLPPPPSLPFPAGLLTPRRGPRIGVGGQEGAFSMCTFWLVEAMTRAGVYEPEYLARAVDLFENVSRRASPLPSTFLLHSAYSFPRPPSSHTDVLLPIPICAPPSISLMPKPPPPQLSRPNPRPDPT